MPSMRINVVMLALGCFLLGAVWGILIYEVTWYFNNYSFKPSSSILAVNSTIGGFLFGLISGVGAVLLVFGIRNIFWKNK
jgi:hypothetical protein